MGTGTRSASPSNKERDWDGGQSLHERMMSSYRNRPHPQDGATITPVNPVPLSRRKPQFPTVPLLTPLEHVEGLEEDTLFFIFYYQQGTYEQFLAGRELKRRSWRFHKKYMTWFQHYEEPKVVAPDKDQGSYVYFDFEKEWTKRTINDFTFEYQYLEDEVSI